MIQAYSLLVCQAQFSDASFQYVTVHASLVIGLVNMGKTLALELDFYGHGRPQQEIGCVVPSYVWEQNVKSPAKEEVQVLAVTDYSYVVGRFNVGSVTYSSGKELLEKLQVSEVSGSLRVQSTGLLRGCCLLSIKEGDYPFREFDAVA